MSHPEYPMASDDAYQIAEELRQNFSIMGHPYNNVVLSTNHPEFVDMYDPNMLITREALTLYWPGGSPVHSHQFETILLVDSQDDEPSNSEFAQEAMTIRTAVLQASVGKAALNRVPVAMRQGWEEVKLAHPAPILYAIDRCELMGLPLALCQTGRIAESKVAPQGVRMMHLWYPNYLSPKPVLTTLQRVIRDTMAQEII